MYCVVKAEPGEGIQGQGQRWEGGNDAHLKVPLFSRRTHCAAVKLRVQSQDRESFRSVWIQGLGRENVCE